MIADDNYSLETQREAVEQETAHRNFAVGFLKGNTLSPTKDIVITPKCIKKLVDNNIPVFVERKLGKGADYIDLDYADVGATIEDEATKVCQNSKILIRLSAFSAQEILALPKELIIITPFPIGKANTDLMSAIQERKITALSLNLIQNVEGGEFLQDILNTKEGPWVASAALGNTIISLIFPFVFNDNIRYALQANPLLIKSIYTYKGLVTNKEIGESTGFPYNDLLLLTWTE